MKYIIKRILGVLLTLTMLCLALCFNVSAEIGFSQTIYYENFEDVNDDELSAMFVKSGNDSASTLSVEDDPEDMNGKVLSLTNKIWSGTGTLYTQVKFADQNVLDHLASQDKKILAMDFDVMFDEQTASISRYFLSGLPESGSIHHGMNKYGSDIRNFYGKWSTNYNSVLTGIEDNKWYNACVSYMFDDEANNVKIKTVIKEKGASGARSVGGWTNITTATFTDNNITDFALLYNSIQKGAGTVGNISKVYIDNIKLFTAETEDDISIVAPRFIDDAGADVTQLTNGSKVKINLTGIELGNNAHRIMPIMALKNKDTGVLIDFKFREYGNSTWRNASVYEAGYSSTYLEIPTLGNYEMIGYVWEDGTTLKPLCMPFSISTNNDHP